VTTTDAGVVLGAPLAGARELPNADGRAGSHRLVVAGALGVWLGIHALRMFLTMVVWNVAEDAPAPVMGLVAGAVWVGGLLGWVPGRLLRRHAPIGLAVLFAALSIARQLWVGETATAALSFAACVAWLWWLAAYVRAAVDRGAGGLVPYAIVGGHVLQLAEQGALHGLDVPMLGGWPATAGTIAIAATFVVWVVRTKRGWPEGAAQVDGIGAGVVAIGAYVCLQSVLLANPGAIGTYGDLPFPVAIALGALGLLAALAALGLRTGRLLRLGAAVAVVAILVRLARPTEVFELAVVPVQFALGLLLAGAFAPRRSVQVARVYGPFALGAMIFFALTFAFYADADREIVWAVGAGVLGLLALVRGEVVLSQHPRLLRLCVGVAAVGLAASLLPLSLDEPGGGPAPRELTVLQYNVHQGLDARSLPAIREVAKVIDRSHADVVALEEVNRGWTISGGVDYVAWLRWRFPQYHVAYGSMHGALYGNVLMTRYTARQTGFERYPLGASRLPRGYVWAIVPTVAGDAFFAATHLTPYDRGDEQRERAEQARYYVALWDARPRAVLAGDLNAEPGSAAITVLRRGGLRDLLAARGLGRAGTYSSIHPTSRIDYLWASPDVAAVSAEVVRTTASDHLPVMARVRF
jgi:endonuclease/exonuclease/phosphatase family metal-dependent hydrolase